MYQQTKASVNLSDESIRAIGSVGVHHARMRKVAGEPVAAIRGVGHSPYAPDSTGAAMSAFTKSVHSHTERWLERG